MGLLDFRTSTTMLAQWHIMQDQQEELGQSVNEHHIEATNLVRGQDNLVIVLDLLGRTLLTVLLIHSLGQMSLPQRHQIIHLLERCLFPATVSKQLTLRVPAREARAMRLADRAQAQAVVETSQPVQ